MKLLVAVKHVSHARLHLRLTYHRPHREGMLHVDCHWGRLMLMLPGSLECHVFLRSCTVVHACWC